MDKIEELILKILLTRNLLRDIMQRIGGRT